MLLQELMVPSGRADFVENSKKLSLSFQQSEAVRLIWLRDSASLPQMHLRIACMSSWSGLEQPGEGGLKIDATCFCRFFKALV